MDGVAPLAARAAEVERPSFPPALPAEAPLAMPVQSLREAPAAERLPGRARLLARRIFVIGGRVADAVRGA